MAYDPLSVALYYANAFAARTDVYSNWTAEGWRPVREPLTAEVVLAGLTKQGPSISGYMLVPESCVTHVAAIDFDTETGFPAAIEMARLMAVTDIPAYVETSRRGAHLWLLLDRQVPGIAIRRALRAMMQTLGWPEDPKVELRPGSDHVPAAGLGHAIRMPLMPHPKTGQHGKVFDHDGRVVGKTLSEIMLNWETAEADRVLPWAEKYVQPPMAKLPREYRNTHEYPEDTSSVSDILREWWGVANARPGVSVRCPAHDDQHASLSILRDDRRVICKAGGCELNNNDHGRGTYELRKMAPHA